MSDVSSTTYTGVSGAGGGSLIRLTGMASGLDVDGTVKKMMAGEQTKMDKLKQDQQVLQWKQQAYQDIIKDIKDLQSSFFDVTTQSNYYLASSTYSPYDITIPDASASIISATAGVGAKAGNYAVSFTKSGDEAGKLAKAGIKSGNKIAISTTVSSDIGATWNDKSIGISIDSGDAQKINITGVTNATDTAAKINTEIAKNSVLKGKIQAVVTADGKNIMFQPLTDNKVKISNDPSITTVPDGDLGALKGRVINPGSSTTMKDLGLSNNSLISFKIDGSSDKVSVIVKTTDKISDVINNISSQTSGKLTASFSELTGQFTIQTASTGSSQSFKLYGKSPLSDDQVIASAMAASDAAANPSDTTKSAAAAAAAETAKTALATAAAGGTFNGTTYVGDDANAAADPTEAEKILLGIGLVNTGEKVDNTQSNAGNDAVVYITPPGGTATKVVKPSNNFTIDGVSYNLLKDSDSSFTVTTNTQKVHDKIKTFLDKYNAIVDKIQTKLGEKKNYDYKPLTDSQKTSMKDAEITAWETKAKVGILRNDNNLQNLLTDLRSAFTSGVKNSDGSAATSLYFGKSGPGAIGIDTSDVASDGGKITIVDDSKLNDVISQYGDQLMKLFTNTSTATDKTDKFNESGIFQRISSIVTSNVGSIASTYNNATLTKYANLQDDFSITGGAGDHTLPDQIYYQQILIKNMTTKMSDKQEKYYQQFSKLETAMSRLNNQQSMLSSMLSG